jgi:hypothetical protein
MTKEEATEKARQDLAKRLGVQEKQITDQSVTESDFPDMALGAASSGEMSGQMISKGWKIRFKAGNQDYEYRADKNQLRLYQFKGKNYRV